MHRSRVPPSLPCNPCCWACTRGALQVAPSPACLPPIPAMHCPGQSPKTRHPKLLTPTVRSVVKPSHLRHLTQDAHLCRRRGVCYASGIAMPSHAMPVQRCLCSSTFAHPLLSVIALLSTQPFAVRTAAVCLSVPHGPPFQCLSCLPFLPSFSTFRLPLSLPNFHPSVPWAFPLLPKHGSAVLLS